MDTRTINKSLRDTNNFIGIYPRDNLPKRVTPPISLVANTDTSDKPGEHWIAIYIDEDGVGEYFDSYGFPPMHRQFIEFLSINCPNGYFSNFKPLQCLTCVTCGHYCIAYIKMRTNGISYNEFINLFTNNQLTNDKLIKKYVSII